MNLKAELQKMNVSDLRYICKEIGVKCSLKEKNKIVSYLLQPIQDIKTYRASGESKTQQSDNYTKILAFGTPSSSPIKIRNPESPNNLKRTRNDEPPPNKPRQQNKRHRTVNLSDRKYINRFRQRLDEHSNTTINRG